MERVTSKRVGRLPSILLRATLMVLAAIGAAVIALDLSIPAPNYSTPPALESQNSISLVIQSHRHQQWQGFGASGAWWSGPVGSFSAAAKAKVGQLLFSNTGLALSQFRYNIGGGGAGVLVSWKAPPSVLKPDGSFDWNADPKGMYFLEQAKSYGVTSLIGFVNAAPTQFTTNHLSCGGFLDPKSVGAYARYLAEFVAGMQSHFGIKLSYISPMNEPDNSFPSCKQEGMAVPVQLRGPLVVALGKELARLAPWCRIIADESSKVDSQLLPHLTQWMGYPGAAKSVAVIAHHLYDFPGPAVLSKMATEISSFGKPSWMTEICCYNGARFGFQYDPTMVSGVWLSDLIFKSLTFGGDSAFQWWTALSPDLGCDPKALPSCPSQINYLGRNDGLVYYQLNGAKAGNERFYLPKRYYTFANFSRFIRPGAFIYTAKSDFDDAEAVVSKKGSTWTVVVIDAAPVGSAASTVQIRFPPGSRIAAATGAWETSPTMDLRPVAPAQVVGDLAISSVAPMSVTTYQFTTA